MPNALQQLEPDLHLVACRTATGSVTFFATRHPTEQLIHLGTELEVDRRIVAPTPHADRIVHELQSEFADERLTQWAGRPYFHPDWERVEQAISEFDLPTGRRMRRSGVSVGDTVQVQMGLMEQPRSRGEVMAIAEKRYLVALERPIGEVKSGWFTRLLIKPVVRVPALVGSA